MHCPMCDADNGPVAALVERGHRCTACGASPNPLWWYREERRRRVVFGDTFDRYRLLGEPAEDATTLTLPAERLDDGRPVTLVVYRPWLVECAGFVDAFAEAAALQRAADPALVTELELGRTAELYFVAREPTDLPVAGSLLGIPRSWRLALGIVRRICALHLTAHQLGVNLRFRVASTFLGLHLQPGADPYRMAPEPSHERFEVRVDVFATHLTRRWIIATEDEVKWESRSELAHLAPEMLMSGGRSTPATVVYLLGLLAYELITGVRPFPASSPVTLITAQLRTSPVACSQLAPGVPPEVDALISRCLQPRDTLRFSSSDELATAIDQLQR